MIKAQERGKQVVIKIQSNELQKYADDIQVFVPRTTISSQIVKLQNTRAKTENNTNKLMLLISSFHSQTKNTPIKSKFIKLNAKIVLECFKDEIVSVYINE